MDKYSKQAFKITIALFLSLTGFTAMIGIAKASPPSGYDFGRKTRIWHDFWWVIQWRLTAAVSVKYNNDEGDYITGYTTSGSGTWAPAWNWNTYGYSYYVSTSIKSDLGWYWIQLDNSAHFRAYDDSCHIIAYATCKVLTSYWYEADWCFYQLYGPFIWIVGDNVMI